MERRGPARRGGAPSPFPGGPIAFDLAFDLYKLSYNTFNKLKNSDGAKINFF